MHIAVRRFWVAVALLVTFVFGVVYVSIQQSLRRAANEPQASMAREAARDLDAGSRPLDVTGGRRIDIAYDMTPFLIVYDKSGRVVAGKGYLKGRVPQVPIGVLRAANTRQSNTVTWQPESGVRIASASFASNDYYVLGGRSLAQADAAINTVGRTVLASWLVALALTFLGYIVVRRRTASRT